MSSFAGLDEIVIIAVSGRALAQSAAKRSGVQVTVLDVFGDLDTQAVARSYKVGADGAIALDPSRVQAALRALGAAPARRAIVAGSGFERQPQWLTPLTGFGRLCCNEPELIAALKQPELSAQLLQALGWDAPQTQLVRPADPRGWLRKDIGGAGGMHVRSAQSSPPSERTYYQRQVAGRPMSATFVADGKRAVVLGFNAQRIRVVADSPFCYAGAATVELPAALADCMQQRLDRLVRLTGLRGLLGLDFMLDGAAVQVLEVNPRPTATFELYDVAFAEGLVYWHIRSFEPAGLAELAERMRQHAQPAPRAYAIVFAQQPVRIPVDVRYPAWCHDLPAGGSVIGAGAPVLSVFAEGATAAQAARRLWEREVQVEAMLERWIVSSHDARAA